MSNILSEVHPELVAEWSDKNLPLTPDRITYGSNKVVWWKGACGHEYTMQGDYNLPDLTMPEQPEVTLGRYAQMRRKFLKEHHKIRYYNLLTSCTLTQHLAELEQTAMKLEETLMKQMAAQEGLTESLKAADMMKWVQGMNNLRNRVQEIVKAEIIFA